MYPILLYMFVDCQSILVIVIYMILWIFAKMIHYVNTCRTASTRSRSNWLQVKIIVANLMLDFIDDNFVFCQIVCTRLPKLTLLVVLYVFARLGVNGFHLVNRTQSYFSSAICGHVTSMQPNCHLQAGKWVKIAFGLLFEIQNVRL